MYELANHLFFIGQGLVLTLELLCGSLLIGLMFGFMMAIFRYVGKAIWFINIFISVVRGTPLILQLSFIYFALPTLLGLPFSLLTAGIMAFGFNSAAYFAEIIRAGIESVPKGQFEAAFSLQIAPFFLWKDIILPQVIHQTFPALTNEVITLVKETALISTIGGMDLMRHAQSLAAEQYSYFMPLGVAAFYYYSLVLLIEAISRRIEVNHAVNCQTSR